MKLEDEDFKKRLEEAARSVEIELNDKQLEKMLLFKKELLIYNEKINLTSIVDDEEIIYKHFIDSLETVRHIKEGSRIIDIGSGAGFPGILIAIYFEGNVEITLLDSLNKRTVFLESIVEKLKIKNIKIITSRAEDFAKKEKARETYDYSTARAVAGLNVLLEYSIPFLKIGGKALLLKGKNKQEEIENSKHALQKLNCNITNIYEFCYIVNDEKYERNIIQVLKEKTTDTMYPRAYGKIKTHPL